MSMAGQVRGRLSRWDVARRLLFMPWRWLAITVVWTLFSHGTTIRDNFLSTEWRQRLQPLDHLPMWPWWVWLVGVLILTVPILLEGSFRWISEQHRALYDRELPGLNADEIAPWREKGRTLTHEWRHLLQHKGASQYQSAAKEVEEWRIDMRARLERKYGGWVANIFNETREADSTGLPVLSPLMEHEARVDRLAQIMYDVGTGRIPPRNAERF
jgi:hypothetical protein